VSGLVDQYQINDGWLNSPTELTGSAVGFVDIHCLPIGLCTRLTVLRYTRDRAAAVGYRMSVIDSKWR
jgi:hypothetical protein